MGDFMHLETLKLQDKMTEFYKFNTELDTIKKRRIFNRHQLKEETKKDDEIKNLIKSHE